MLKRISSGFLELRRALSWGSRVDASGPNQNTQNEDGQNASAPAAPAAPIVADSEERKEFDKTLDIVHPSAELPLELPELPYALPGGYSVDAEGHLRAYANTGFVVDETPEFHSTLRQNPGVAAAIKSLHIVLQGPQEIDLTKRDSTAATQRKGLSEWSKTIPALKNLTKVKISHFSSSAAVDGEDVIYVPGEDEAEKNATAEEKGHLDVSAVIKSLAWYAEDLNLVELEGVDFSEEAAKAFEGSKVTSLRLEACPTRVSSVIPRLSKLSEIIVTEKGDFSVGCDYIGLLNHVKGTLTAVALNLRDSKIDLQEFTTSLSGAPLTIIRCSFASSTPELTAEEIEQKLKDAFPTFGRPAGEEKKLTGEDEQPQQPPQHQAEPSSESTATTVFSTPVKKASESEDMELDSTTGGISGSDAEMGMLSERNSGTSTPTRKALKRSALVERRKEELKAAELASSKDKLSKITGTGSVPRKLRSTPSRHK